MPFLGLLYWNLGVIFVYTCTHWQNRELRWCMSCRWYVCIMLRCEEVQSMACYMATLRFNKHAKSGGTKFEIWAIPGPCQSGWICILGVAGRAGGSDAAGRTAESVTYSLLHCDTEAQQQVPGPGCLPPCSPEPGSCKDLPPLIRKGRKHHWRHYGKGDVGTPVMRGPGGPWVREGAGICRCYRWFVPQSPDLAHWLPRTRMGKECQGISLEL